MKKMNIGVNVMNKLFVIIMLLMASAQSGVMSSSGYVDTCDINTFRADSFRVTKAITYGEYENKMAVFVFDDSLHTGRVNDSVACEIGYQLGKPVWSTSGVYDSSWSSCMPLDTINTTVGGQYDPSKYTTGLTWDLNPESGVNVRPVGVIDTTVGAASSAVWIPQIPYYAPFARYYVKGITGNCGTFIRCHFELNQRPYSGVRAR